MEMGTDLPCENESTELGDEQQDFRFLAHLTRQNATIPRRGEKDFEPDGTEHQDHMLQESRKAMYEAICRERKHSAKSHCEATWHPEKGMAKVLHPKGVHFKSVGKATREATWLLPEETIFLVERGSLECLYNNGIPMSLQAVYSACMEECSAERYQVYANLKRSGYHVLRAEKFSVVQRDPVGRSIISTLGVWSSGLFSLLFTRFCDINPNGNGPLVIAGEYSTYADVLKKLQIIPSHSNKTPSKPLPSKPLPSHNTSIQVTYNVWKPNSNFKKSAPGLPDFRIVVVDARAQCVPNLQQLSTIFDDIPFDEKQSNNPFGRLKTGARNVVFAVVDSGLTSFIRFNDISFSDERIWEGKEFRGKGKRGRKATRNNAK